METQDKACREAFCKKYGITDEVLDEVLSKFSLWQMKYEAFCDGFALSTVAPVQQSEAVGVSDKDLLVLARTLHIVGSQGIDASEAIEFGRAAIRRFQETLTAPVDSVEEGK